MAYRSLLYILLGNGKRMLTCSAAAGPALEGARITHGMIGKAGAIEGVRFEDNHLNYRVIGNIPPKGICGSGLVDLVAVLLHHGFIDSEGLLSPPEIPERDDMISRMKSREGKSIYDFLVASSSESFDGRSIYLTQNDIRELQLAKGAIAAGIKRLLTAIGATIDDVDKVYLAGALGNYINPLSAMRIGLVPRIDPDKIVPLGNAASTGAQMVLLSRHHWERVSDIARFLEHKELSCDPDFFDDFVEEMDFPQENLW
ncbi:MAG: ATP-binding protein [Desulfobacteraceae bacterium]|nr:ATP-binding protein [Desulfobacteraceae bacterium]